jgi:hypothetical protein
MCVLIFSTPFVWNIFHSVEEMGEIWQKVSAGLHLKYRLYLSDFNKNLIPSNKFRKILKYQISWKSVQWGPSWSMRTDGRMDTDMAKLIVAFRSFTNAPINGTVFEFYVYLCITSQLQVYKGQDCLPIHKEIWKPEVLFWTIHSTLTEY